MLAEAVATPMIMKNAIIFYSASSAYRKWQLVMRLRLIVPKSALLYFDGGMKYFMMKFMPGQ